MRSRWRSLEALDPSQDYLVLASRIPAKRITSTWKLFRGSSAVRQQLLRTDGVVGFSMLAEPLKKHYATLSVWRNDAVLDAFASEPPHAALMVDLAPEMGDTAFVRWTISGRDGLPSWSDALDRLT